MNSKINIREYIEKHVKIKDKNSEIIPFKLNIQQERLYNKIKELQEKGKPIRIIVLKSRQMGLSTLTEGIIFTKTVLNCNMKAGIITHSATATNNLYGMFQTMYYNLPDTLKPYKLKTNAQEMVFDTEDRTGLNSGIKCMTAGSDGVGRSDTFNMLHISELAFWPKKKEETLLGLLQAVPSTPNSIVIIESTANGYEYFKKMWDDAVAGKNDFIPYFASWIDFKEYELKYTGFEITEEEKELMDRYNLSKEKITWRRWCIKNNCGNDINKFKQEYPLTPEEAFISTGDTIFTKEKIVARIEDIREIQPIKKGYFDYRLTGDKYGNPIITDIEFIEDNEKGFITIYEEVKKGYPYVISGDTAGMGIDYFTGQVINNVTKKQVAVLRKQKIAEDKYAEQMFCLGQYYNNALLGIETNYSTYPQERIVQLDYPNIFVNEKIDGVNKGKLTQEYGFKTTAKTRPYIIAELVKIIEEDITVINDVNTLKEMLTFAKNSVGRAEAMQGEHDDLIMALAIAFYLCNFQTVVKQKEEKKKIVLPDALKTDETYYESYW